MICKHCGTDDSDATTGDLQDVECNISGPNSLPCDPCKELADLEKTMARLAQRRSELKRNINYIHSPVIRRIPSEIIAKISEFTTTDFTIGIGSLPTLMLLSFICSDWRQIVVGTPQLWSSININLPSTSQMYDMTCWDVRRLATFFDELLARSGQLPLHISLCFHSRYSTMDVEDIKEEYSPIFKILNCYSSRWRSLKISIPSTLFSLLQPECLPLLEQLHFNEQDHKFDEYVLTFPPLPNLKAVGIVKPFTDFYPLAVVPLSDFRIQWDNVTHLSVEGLTVRQSLELLSLFPKLVHGEFLIVSYRWGEDQAPSLESPIPIPLTYLSLSSYEGSLCEFFDNLLLPSLETLLLSDASAIGALITCLERSACSLCALSLKHFGTDSDILIRLLHLVSPSLTKLELVPDRYSPNDSYQQYLSILTKIYSSQTQSIMGNSDFLPHLEVFKIIKEFTLSNSATPLSNLPTPTYPGLVATPIPLRSVHIDLSIFKAIPLDISSLFKRLDEDGIVVTLFKKNFAY